MPRAAQWLPDAASLAEDRGVDLDVHECPGCGLVQTTGEPVPYFREVIRAAGFSDEMKVFRTTQFAEFARAHGLFGRKVIEIGCGRGEYLALLRQAGMDARGLEHGPAAVRHCREAGLRVEAGFVDSRDYAIPHAPYDGFAVLNFLEHWPDPNASLSGIAGNLADGGIGLVEVPNLDMMLRKSLFSEFIADHTLYFTRETLETTLRLNGFEVVECAEVWHDYILSAVVRKRPGCDVSSFEGGRLRLKRDVDDFIGRHRHAGVAIWGAGHQALATIALLGIAGDIRYVVDSAPFKQKRFTPASHIPIVEPGRLETEPVGAVIVMAAAYSDEVAGIVRRSHPGLPVAVLRDTRLDAD
jgi:SAM-dependent methyltransferase